jgi:hypothetical protein
MKKLNILGTGMIALVAIAVQPGQAAEAPKSGHAEFDAYLTQRIVSTIDSGVGKGMIVEGDGFDRLVNGQAPFELLTFRCVSQIQNVGDKSDSSGSCVKTDKDGDHIFYTWEHDGWAFVGGTGKFKGITGKGVYAKPTYFHDSGDHGFELIAHHVVDWEIK